MGKTDNTKPKLEPWILPTRNKEKEYVVSGRLVNIRDKNGSEASELSSTPSKPSATPRQAQGKDAKLFGLPGTIGVKNFQRRSDLPPAPEVLTLDQLARRSIEGLDYTSVMNELTDLGPEGRLLLRFRNGTLERHELFEDPRICKDIERGGVIHNLEQTPQDVSGWRVHEFYIDSKGCLGDVCSRCLRVCPENAIHLRGEGAGSFCEIDPTACKGCYICWVECTRKAADCILIDGKVFDSELRARHFGE